MAERRISQATLLEALRAGERIEDYPDDEPYPSALFLASVAARPIHVVAAMDADSDWAYIITAYEPGLDHFSSDFRTRRSP